MKDYRLPAAVTIPAAIGLVGVLWLLRRKSGDGKKKTHKAVLEETESASESNNQLPFDEQIEHRQTAGVIIPQQKIPEGSVVCDNGTCSLQVESLCLSQSSVRQVTLGLGKTLVESVGSESVSYNGQVKSSASADFIKHEQADSLAVSGFTSSDVGVVTAAAQTHLGDGVMVVGVESCVQGLPASLVGQSYGVTECGQGDGPLPVNKIQAGECGSLTSSDATQDGQRSSLASSHTTQDGECGRLTSSDAAQDGQRSSVASSHTTQDGECGILTSSEINQDGQRSSLASHTTEDGQCGVLASSDTAQDGQRSSLASHTTQDGECGILASSDTAKNGQHSSLASTDTVQDGQHSKLASTDTVQDGQHSKLASTDSVQDGQHSSLASTDSVQDGQHSSLASTDTVQDGQHSSLASTDSVQDGQHSSLASTDSVQDGQHSSLASTDSVQDGQHSSLASTDSVQDGQHSSLASTDSVQDGQHSSLASLHTTQDGECGIVSSPDTTNDDQCSRLVSLDGQCSSLVSLDDQCSSLVSLDDQCASVPSADAMLDDQYGSLTSFDDQERDQSSSSIVSQIRQEDVASDTQQDDPYSSLISSNGQQDSQYDSLWSSYGQLEGNSDSLMSSAVEPDDQFDSMMSSYNTHDSQFGSQVSLDADQHVGPRNASITEHGQGDSLTTSQRSYIDHQIMTAMGDGLEEACRQLSKPPGQAESSVQQMAAETATGNDVPRNGSSDICTEAEYVQKCGNSDVQRVLVVDNMHEDDLDITGPTDDLHLEMTAGVQSHPQMKGDPVCLETETTVHGLLGSHNTESLESANIECLEPSKTESLEASNTESLEASNTESLESSNIESLEASNTESMELANTESVELANTESLELANTESLESSNTESFQSANIECLEPSNTESLESSNTESLESSNTESLESSNTEVLESSNTESLGSANIECLEPANTEDLVSTTTLSLESANNESLVSTSVEYLEPANLEHPQSLNTESLEPANTESLEPANTESLEPANTESLEPDNTEYLEPDNTESLEPANTESLEPANTESLERANTESLEPANTESLEPANTESLEPANTESLEPANTECLASASLAYLEQASLVDSQSPNTESLEPVNTESLEPANTESLEPANTECLASTSLAYLEQVSLVNTESANTESLESASTDQDFENVIPAVVQEGAKSMTPVIPLSNSSPPADSEPHVHTPSKDLHEDSPVREMKQDDKHNRHLSTDNCLSAVSKSDAETDETSVKTTEGQSSSADTYIKNPPFEKMEIRKSLSWLPKASSSSVDSFGPDEINAIWGIESAGLNLDEELTFLDNDPLDVPADGTSVMGPTTDLGTLEDVAAVASSAGEDNMVVAASSWSPSDTSCDNVVADPNVKDGALGKSISPVCDNNSEGSNDSGRGGSEHEMVCQGGEALVHFHFCMPSDLCGQFIGKQGKNINYLKSKCGAHVSLTSNAFMPEYQICQIVGTQAEVDDALSMIRRKFPLQDYPHLTMDPIDMSMPVPLQPDSQVVYPEVMQLSLPEGVSVEVYVSAVVDAGQVFVQQPTHRSYMSLEKMNHFLNLVYSHDPNVPSVPLPIESGVICVCESEGYWYRAMIMSPVDENGEVQLKFVDYGGYIILPVTSLKQIRVDFMHLPFQAVECFMANITPNQGEKLFSDESTQALCDLTQGKLLQCQVVARTDYGVPYIHLYQVNPERNSAVLINRALVNRRLVQWIEIL